MDELLNPIQISGATLEGIDLSPDGKELAVADNSNDGSNVWVYLVNPDSLAVTKASVGRSIAVELGSYDVGFLGDGSLLVSYTQNAAPIRRLDLSSMKWSMLATHEAASTLDGPMISVSANGKVAGISDPGDTSGSWEVYYLDTNNLVGMYGLTVNGRAGTDTVNSEMGTNIDGTQFAIPTYYGTYVYDTNYQKIATLGVHAGPQPIGAASDPTNSLAYFPWSGSGDVRVYDMQTFQQVGSYNFQDTFNINEHSFVQGRTRVSHYGALLMVTVTGGVRFVKLLNANPVTATSNGRHTVISLPAARDTGRVAYGLSSPNQRTARPSSTVTS